MPNEPIGRVRRRPPLTVELVLQELGSLDIESLSMPNQIEAFQWPVDEFLGQRIEGHHHQSTNMHDAEATLFREVAHNGSEMCLLVSSNSPGIHENLPNPAAMSSFEMPSHLHSTDFPNADNISTRKERSPAQGPIASADINNNLHTNALCCAVDSGSDDMIQCLLRAGADPMTKDSNGRTALHYAARHSTAVILNRLLGPAVDLDVRDSQGRTPLFTAVESGSIDIVRILLRLGASLYAKDIFGVSVLCVAVQSGSLRLVEMLLEFGADANG